MGSASLHSLAWSDRTFFLPHCMMSDHLKTVCAQIYMLAPIYMVPALVRRLATHCI